MASPLTIEHTNELRELVQSYGESVLVSRREYNGSHFNTDGSLTVSNTLERLELILVVGSTVSRFLSEDALMQHARKMLTNKNEGNKSA